MPKVQEYAITAVHRADGRLLVSLRSGRHGTGARMYWQDVPDCSGGFQIAVCDICRCALYTGEIRPSSIRNLACYPIGVNTAACLAAAEREYVGI